jgi:hypothetical protein
VTRAAAIGALAAVMAVLAGCGDEGDDTPAEPKAEAVPRTETEATPRPARAERSRPRPLSCPSGTGNCAAASGRIVYVERVDPDGDGDAHFVIASKDSITAPGISVIDVKRSLRPSPLPGTGDWISAAGPVYDGSHGQNQIEAVRVRVRRLG